MPAIPKKVVERIAAGIKRFQPIVATAKARDVGESDTVTIITDMLAELFGYDKYADITSELPVRGTRCDLGVKVDGKLVALIECKAVGIELKDAHIKQAVDYAANQGIEWAVLTNATRWCVYRLTFGKPVESELVVDMDFAALSAKGEESAASAFLLCKEGWTRSALGDYHEQRQALSRFYVGAVILSDEIVSRIRRELRRASPDVKIEESQVRAVLENEVIKREILEGERAVSARRKVTRASAQSEKATKQLDPVIVTPNNENKPA